MSDTTKRVEAHGCLVCGRVYDLLVVYDPAGRMLDCTVTSPGGRRIPDEHRPLVACERHTEAQVEAAMSRHYPGQEQPEDKED